MAKKDTVPTLTGYEQVSLRTLIALGEQAKASFQAAAATQRNYLIQLLTSRGLDPTKWGVSSDMATFVEVKPPAPVQAPPVPARDPRAFAESAPVAPPAPVPETVPAQA